MARPKRIKAAPVSPSTTDLLAQVQRAVGKIELPDGSKADYNPVVQLAIFASRASDADDEKEKRLRLDAAKEVAKYLHAPLKSIEIAGTGGGPIKVEVTRYSDAKE